MTDVQETNESSEDGHGSGNTVTERQIQMPRRAPMYHQDNPWGTLDIDEYGQQTPPTDVEPEPLLAGSGEFVDHFCHSAEAYASGNYSCASFRPPRSRSPTPEMDDEDYHIVVSDDVQPGTDETPQYPQYGHNRYPNEKYGDTFGQDTFYDYDDGREYPCIHSHPHWP